MRKVLALLFIALTLASCSIVEVEHYVHEETEAIRSALDYQVSNTPLRRAVQFGDNQTILVPDFYRFWPGFSASGNLHVLTREAQAVTIETAELFASNSTKSEMVYIKKDTRPRIDEDGVWIDTVLLIDLRCSVKFKGEEKLVLVVRWRNANSANVNESRFVLIRKINKEIAWIT